MLGGKIEAEDLSWSYLKDKNAQDVVAVVTPALTSLESAIKLQ